MDSPIRVATEADCEAICSIYNHYVDHCTCTFQTERETVQERLDWMRAHGPRHPVIVYRDGADVVGWASLNRYHPRGAYRFTAELSIYHEHRNHRRGIGSELMTDLIDRARTLGYHVLIGGVCGEREPSLRLHESFGFAKVGHFPKVGFKFGRWLDVAYYQLTFNENRPPIEDEPDGGP